MVWVTLLAVGVAAARPRIGSRLLATLDAVAGTAIIGFGGRLAWRTLREDS
jgi:threonine/homoserine/homoserine lactone efflux protein